MNLWDIISAVNSTVREKPSSNIAKLISKFEVRQESEKIKVKEANESLSNIYFFKLAKQAFH